jgi:two-component system sensor histidine kinase BaeS
MEHNEEARRRWVADISHELRTPLTFLRSQVEAILDGVRQPTTESVKAVHNEIMRFTRLVDDLYQLSMSDVGAQTYRKDEVAVSEVIQQAVSIFSPDFSAKSIALHCEAIDNVTVFGDAERLRQLFGNLLDNSLKYTDPGGELRIRVCKDSGRVMIDFQDSAPGVPETELEKLFERLYRLESSRSRATGGAGLGLAICRNIVEAHEGTILAKPSPLGGVWIRVNLPCYGSV